MTKLQNTERLVNCLVKALCVLWQVPTDSVHISVHLFRNPVAYDQAKAAGWKEVIRGSVSWFESAAEIDRVSIVAYKPRSDIQ